VFVFVVLNAYICKKYQHVVNMELLSKQIKARRQELKTTQQELAELADVSINTIVAVERGTANPRIATLLSICNVLGLQLKTTLKD
jgi:putative transcriptional regulator